MEIQLQENLFSEGLALELQTPGNCRLLQSISKHIIHNFSDKFSCDIAQLKACLKHMPLLHLTRLWPWFVISMLFPAPVLPLLWPKLEFGVLLFWGSLVSSARCFQRYKGRGEGFCSHLQSCKDPAEMKELDSAIESPSSNLHCCWKGMAVSVSPRRDCSAVALLVRRKRAQKGNRCSPWEVTCLPLPEAETQGSWAVTLEST